jgi:hypothetical protein
MKMLFTVLAFIAVLILALPERSQAQLIYLYGATDLNQLTEPQLNLAFEKAEKLKAGGVAMTVIGSIVAIVGGSIYINGLNNIVSGPYSQIDDNYATAMAGVYLMTAGGCVATIGVPLWIIAAIRKSDIEIALAKFSAKVAMNPILFRAPSSCGLGISLSFKF